MSLFKAALTGFSAAGANVANKYLDEQIAKDRAEFMAQLQRRTAGEIRADDFSFKTDPGRVQTTRDIAAGDVAAKATATRDAEKAGWGDTEYQAGRDAQTEKDTQAEVKRQSLMAEARAKAEARFRPRTGGPSLGEQIKERETILGRKLTQQELESFVGLGKGKPTKDDPGAKAAIDAVFKRYENGEITADKIGSELRVIQESVEAEPQVAAIQGAVQRARGEGKVSDLVAEMRAAGFNEARMTAAGLTADEIKAASAGKPSRRQQPSAAQAPSAPQMSFAPQEPNPFVDKKGRPLAQPTAASGGSHLTESVIPAAKEAVRSVDTSMTQGYKRWLEDKIKRGEKLTQGEEIRAQQLGLMR